MLKILIVNGNKIPKIRKKSYEIVFQEYKTCRIEEINYEDIDYIICKKENKIEPKKFLKVASSKYQSWQYDIFMTELYMNSAFNDILELSITDKRQLCSVAIVLRNIIKNNISVEKFELEELLKKIKESNNFSNEIMKEIKEDVCNVVRRHYSCGNLFRLIKYRINKKVILKKYIYKNINSIVLELEARISELDSILLNKEIRRILSV